MTRRGTAARGYVTRLPVPVSWDTPGALPCELAFGFLPHDGPWKRHRKADAEAPRGHVVNLITRRSRRASLEARRVTVLEETSGHPHAAGSRLATVLGDSTRDQLQFDPQLAPRLRLPPLRPLQHADATVATAAAMEQRHAQIRMQPWIACNLVSRVVGTQQNRRIMV